MDPEATHALGRNPRSSTYATGLSITVCHFPPGTSKWNKIEHRLFSFISTNWRGKPVISHEIIINLITATTTSTGLKVYAQLDNRPYPKEVEVSDEELAAVNITRNPSTATGTTPSLLQLLSREP
jgi:hypothetical protein